MARHNIPSSQQVECVFLARKPVLCCLSRLKQPPKSCSVCQPAAFTALQRHADLLFSVYYFKSLTFNKLEATLRRFYVYRILTICKVLWPLYQWLGQTSPGLFAAEGVLGAAGGIGLKLNQKSST